MISTILVALLASPLLAQSSPASPTLLDRLASEHYDERETATAELLCDDTITLDALRALYRDAATPEQRERLLDAARHHFLRHARETSFNPEGDPAIGFSHDIRKRARTLPTGQDAAVVFVVTTLPGFPGYAHLRAGDLVIAVDDEPFPADLDNDAFKQRLRTQTLPDRPGPALRAAGDTISLTLLRDGRELRVTLRLATTEALERMYTQAPQLQEPYHTRWTQLRDELRDAAPPTPVITIPQ